MKRHILKTVFFVVSTLLISCEKSDIGVYGDGVNNFVWRGLNGYYLWQDKVPDLSDTRFSSQNQLNNYVKNFDAPDNLFYSLLYNYQVADKYSWIVSDYVALENSFQGITFTNGMEFGLVRYTNDPTQLFGYVRYAVPDSNADLAGIRRGMIFNQVNGQQLTIDNYRSLLFSSNFDYTISLANFNNGNPIATGGTVDLMRSQVQENPVAITRVFVEGSQRIGYLLYNQFASSFDAILNDAFANLQGAGITDLIVDLRYNPGGSVRTATYLGGMITGQFAGQLFSKEVWNSKVQANVNTNSFNNLFTNQINNGLVTQNINSLNLTRVYFIVTGGSASASELLINSLKSYIDVKLVGTTTEGKNVGSVTLYDSPNFSRNGANPNHTWAMQPIVLEIQNKDGVTSPDGFTPEIAMPEDYGNLGVLGDRNEPLLDRTITYILTGMRSSRITTVPQLEEVTNSKLFTPTRDNMYVDLKKE